MSWPFCMKAVLAYDTRIYVADDWLAAGGHAGMVIACTYIAAPPSIKGVYCSGPAFPFNSYFCPPFSLPLSLLPPLSLTLSHHPSILPSIPRHMNVHCQSIRCGCMYIHVNTHCLKNTVQQAYNKERSTVQRKNSLHTYTESNAGYIVR